MKRFENFVEGLNDDLAIPNLVDEKFEEALQMAGNKKKRYKFTGVKVAVAAMAVVIAGGTFCVSNPTLASKLPLIGHIFEKVGDKSVYSGNFNKKNNLSDNNEREKLSAEDKGITVTASEVYSDGLSIFVSLKVDSNKYDFSKIPTLEETKGQVMNMVLAYGINQDIQFQDYDISLSGENYGEHSFIGIAKFDNNELSKEDGILNIQIKNFYIEGEEDVKAVKGNWTMQIPFNVDKEGGKEITVDKKAANGLKVQKLFVSPYQIVVFSEVPYTKPYENMTDEEILAEGYGQKDAGGESLSSEEIQQMIKEVRQQKFYGYYEIAVFDQDGDRLEFEEMGNQATDLQQDLFSVRGKTITKLHVYVMQDEDHMFELIKAKTEDEAKKVAEMDFTVDVK